MLKNLNDPNGHLNQKQFVIFPKERLDWGSKYYATITYNDGSSKTKTWCFSTISLNNYASKAYIVNSTNSSVNLNIVSGQTYAIYLKPRDKNDVFSGYSASGYANTMNVDLIDGNTIRVVATGSVGNSITVSLNNGRDVILTFSSSDSATTPKKESCY